MAFMNMGLAGQTVGARYQFFASDERIKAVRQMIMAVTVEISL